MRRFSAFALVAFSVACGSNVATTPPPDAQSDAAPADAAPADVAPADVVDARDVERADAVADALTVDASMDATGDAQPTDAPPVDAPACPTPMPFRRNACPVRDQLCFYSCGTVFRCTAIGWDYASDVDGGPPCP